MRALGVDIGGTSTKIGIVDEQGNIIKRFSFVIKDNETQEDVITRMGQEIKEFISGEDVSAIGIGCPGMINSRTGYCDFSNNLPWHNLPICKIISEITNKKCFITNDANAAVLGEVRYGCGKQFQNFILITLGTGVGSGLILNGHLYEGEDGKGAELGHIQLDAFNGRECTCGEKGCVETYCSATALIKDAKSHLKEYPDSILHKADKIDAKAIFDGYHSNDELCVRMVDDYIKYIGMAMLAYINVFRPEAIAISGGICRQGDWFVNRIEEYVKQHHYGFGDKNNKPIKILVANLGADTGILGAASVAFENIK